MQRKDRFHCNDCQLDRLTGSTTHDERETTEPTSNVSETELIKEKVYQTITVFNKKNKTAEEVAMNHRHLQQNKQLTEDDQWPRRWHLRSL